MLQDGQNAADQQQVDQPPQLDTALLLQQLVNVTQALANRGSGKNRIKIAEPDDFSGKAGDAKKFLAQCEAYFENCTDASDAQKISCALSHMKSGNALLFAEGVRKARASYNPKVHTDTSKYYQTWDDLLGNFKSVFHERDSTAKAQEKLQNMHQGTRTAEEYVLEFSRYELDAEFDEKANLAFFKKGLQPWIRDKIYGMEVVPKTLDDWKDKAMQFDQNKREQSEFEKSFGRHIAMRPPNSGHSNSRAFDHTPPAPPKQYTPPSGPPPSQAGPSSFVPMDVDRAHQRRLLDFSNIVCRRCGRKGHLQRDCYAKIAVVEEDDQGYYQIISFIEDLKLNSFDESVPAEVSAEEPPSLDFPLDRK